MLVFGYEGCKPKRVTWATMAVIHGGKAYNTVSWHPMPIKELERYVKEYSLVKLDEPKEITPLDMDNEWLIVAEVLDKSELPTIKTADIAEHRWISNGHTYTIFSWGEKKHTFSLFQDRISEAAVDICLKQNTLEELRKCKNLINDSLIICLYCPKLQALDTVIETNQTRRNVHNRIVKAILKTEEKYQEYLNYLKFLEEKYMVIA